ncbi:MAG: hypothetical protein N4A49_10665 [Marinifilaceae bacterium]|jgi:hypothetical protein|nr:hypothetical protein [Marinifilaceae bacterium]
MKTIIRSIFLILIANLIAADFCLAQEQIKPKVKIGGAVRYNIRYKDWDDNSRSMGGDVVMDVFKIDVKADYGKLFLDADYRFYPKDFGRNMIHHGYLGYKFDDQTQVHLGVHKVDFGILPYASHSAFFNLPYYIGFEDDYDTGLKFVHNTKKWDISLAWYKCAEGGREFKTFSDGSMGYGTDNARYSFDLSGDTEEKGQFNGRVAYKHKSHEFGFSAQYGKYFHHANHETKDSYAYAAHYTGKFLPKKNLDLKLQYMKYDYNADSDLVNMGAYTYSYDVASEADIITAGLAYTVPIKNKYIKAVKFYENYNYMNKYADGLNDTQFNVVGMMIVASPIIVFIDCATAKNHDWLGPWGHFGDNHDQCGFGRGEKSPEWNSWFNINIGYYF